MCQQRVLKRHIHPLTTQQVHAGVAMDSATPIVPEHSSRAHREWMQEQTHSSGLCCLVAMPLTQLAQGTDATISDPGGVEHSQGAIMLGALLGRMQRRAGCTAEGPIGLESKVRSCEASSFPGGGGSKWPIPWCASSRIGRLPCDRRDGCSKLGGPH